MRCAEHAIDCGCEQCWREFRERWGGELSDELLREAFEASRRAARRGPGEGGLIFVGVCQAVATLSDPMAGQ